MKKFIAAIFAGIIVMMSVVPAFAVGSPYATTIEATTSSQSDVKKDTGSTSPKTGSNDFLLYAFAGLAVVACGTAIVKLAKSK